MDNDSRQRLNARFIDLAEHLNQQMHNGSKEEWQGLNMTIPQIRTLAALQHAGSLRMGGIARHLGSTLSATSTIVDRLVNKGLVERGPDPSDRRVVVCQLTAEGRTVVADFWRIGRMRIAQVVEPLDEDQLRAVVAAFELLCQTADEALETNMAASAAD